MGKPVPVAAIEPDPEGVVLIGDRVYRNYDMSVSRDTFNAMRAGYVCANCTERFTAAFPEVCPVCNFRPRDDQSARLAEAYKGEKHLGSLISNDDEFEQIKEENERRKFLKNSHVWLPGDPK